MTAVLAILAAGFREITQAGPSSSCAAAVSKGLASSSRRRPPTPRTQRSKIPSTRPVGAPVIRPAIALREQADRMLDGLEAPPLSSSLSGQAFRRSHWLPWPAAYLRLFLLGVTPQHSHLTMIPPSSPSSLPSIALAIVAVRGAARLSCARLKFSAKNGRRSLDRRPASLPSPTL